ncbi:MarR family winged helix-turn-helix transcriptional regulator [Oceanobacillus bengalensis]|uniref:MarR family transcriptional regulator n=1 Tax=Oceanobacillus bengalensis TaxID=1435466 RepID=A0A494Z7U7_9BACI|nr:MarR family transcriptional regulator [Oceanobacillus bengalensis]RKQ18607.1 MarR family transcriptional regulator [Oceanobacillus bengalensis]
MKQTNIFKLIHAIEKMNNENIIRFTKAFRYPLGISPILVLAELRLQGPRKQVELAEILGYTKGSMTNIATKLVNLELAERLYDESDRRIVRLKITFKGLEALEEAKAIGKELFMEHFEVLSEEEIKQYLTIQEKLITGIRDKKSHEP